MTSYPKIALLRSAFKPFEYRIPIHPDHIDSIDPLTKKYLYVEKNYSEGFGYSDAFYHGKIKVEERSALISTADCCLIVRPMPADLELVRENSTVFGWMHCVQDQAMANIAIRRKLTLICMESLFDAGGEYLFEENSRITGHQAISYGLKVGSRVANPDQKVVVIGHGNAGNAAIKKLINLGFHDITCFSKRNKLEIKNAVDHVNYAQIKYGRGAKSVMSMDGQPIFNLLKNFDIIVNATAQDIYHPATFLYLHEIEELQKEILIIDISCDHKMGFDFSQITEFDAPIARYGKASYCAIDHLPTLDFNNATTAISSAILKVLPPLIEYLNKDELYPILKNSIQIKNGKTINKDIKYYKDYFV